MTRLGLWGRWSLVAVIAVAALTLAWAATWRDGAKVRDAGPDSLVNTRSLGQAIAQSADGGPPVHIVFVHGIRANGRGTAAIFVKSLCHELGKLCQRTVLPPSGAPRRLDIGAWPKGAKQAGRQIWKTNDEWVASRPFVDRYELFLTKNRKITIDEVNWWPLLFPLKCRYLVEEDRKLSGFDKPDDALCRNTAVDGMTDPSKFDWLATYKPAPGLYTGGQYWGNKSLKHGVLNWGLSDAVIALGPMRLYTRAAMRKAFEASASLDGRAPEDQTIVLVTESLGSFAVMDALRSSPKTSMLSRTVGQSADLYFFANQFALLEMGRISGLPPSSDAASSPSALTALVEGQSPATTPTEAPPVPEEKSLLNVWAEMPRATSARQKGFKTRQIIAFSDPNDALTFLVPPVPGVTVVNVYDHNGGWTVPFVLTNPLAAHTGHSQNRAVLRTMLRDVD